MLLFFKRPKRSIVAHPGILTQWQKPGPVHQYPEYICSDKASALFKHVPNTSASSTSDVGGMKGQSNNSAKISWTKTWQKQCLYITWTLYQKPHFAPSFIYELTLWKSTLLSENRDMIRVIQRLTINH